MPRYVDLDKLPLVSIDVDTINHTAYVDIREVQQALRQAEAETGEVEMIPEPFRDLIRKSVDAVNDEFTRALDESREAAEELLRQMKEEGEDNG